jgi:hypothetical protein
MRGGSAFARWETDAVKDRQAIDLGMEQNPGKTGNGGTSGLRGEAILRKDLIP